MSQQIVKNDDIVSVDASKVTESVTKVFVTTAEKAAIANKVDKVMDKSLIYDTEISRLGSMTAIFTTALKSTYDAYASAISGKVDIYYPQHNLLVLPSLPSAASYNDYECIVGELVYYSNGIVWTLLTGLNAGTFFFDQDSNLYQVSELGGVNNKIMFATKAAIEALLTGEITSHTHTPYPQTDLATASGTITLATNNVTNLTNTGTGTFTIAFGTATSGKANDYGFIIRIGGTLRTVNWDANIVWKDGTAPTLAINKTYYFVSSKLGSQYLTAFNTY